MKDKIEQVQDEMNTMLGLVLDTVDDLLNKKMQLCRAYQQLELLKKEEETNMYNYELCFMGYYQDEIENYFMQETSWQIRTDKTYEEMAEYVNNLNIEYQAKHNNQSFFTFNQVEVLNECPSFFRLECDLKEL